MDNTHQIADSLSKYLLNSGQLVKGGGDKTTSNR